MFVVLIKAKEGTVSVCEQIQVIWLDLHQAYQRHSAKLQKTDFEEQTTNRHL